jgi:ribosomal protein L24E
VSTDSTVLANILDGYQQDNFCKKVIESGSGIKGVREANSLWYIRNQLLIVRVSDVCKNLFHLGHDS